MQQLLPPDSHSRFTLRLPTKLWTFFCIAFLAIPSLQAGLPWLTLKDCTYIPNPANDGDSFHVRAYGKHYIFRLYFVDAPEVDVGFPGRVEEQAKYFGLTSAQSRQVGVAAQKFTEEKLARPFVIHTCKAHAMGRSRRPRFYAFVQTESGEDLGEILLANGLARVHGVAAMAPGMASPKRERQRLAQLEQEAKKQKVGAWGFNAGRLSSRVQPPEKLESNAFNAFFHPEQVKSSTAPEKTTDAKTHPASAKKGKTKATGGAKLDINTASAKELEALPGIGPVMAKRIIEARPFKSADELRRVKGIGKKKYEKLRPYF